MFGHNALPDLQTHRSCIDGDALGGPSPAEEGSPLFMISYLPPDSSISTVVTLTIHHALIATLFVKQAEISLTEPPTIIFYYNRIHILLGNISAGTLLDKEDRILTGQLSTKPIFQFWRRSIFCRSGCMAYGCIRIWIDIYNHVWGWRQG